MEHVDFNKPKLDEVQFNCTGRKLLDQEEDMEHDYEDIRGIIADGVIVLTKKEAKEKYTLELLAKRFDILCNCKGECTPEELRLLSQNKIALVHNATEDDLNRIFGSTNEEDVGNGNFKQHIVNVASVLKEKFPNDKEYQQTIQEFINSVNISMTEKITLCNAVPLPNRMVMSTGMYTGNGRTVVGSGIKSTLGDILGDIILPSSREFIEEDISDWCAASESSSEDEEDEEDATMHNYITDLDNLLKKYKPYNYPGTISLLTIAGCLYNGINGNNTLREIDIFTGNIAAREHTILKNERLEEVALPK